MRASETSLLKHNGRLYGSMARDDIGLLSAERRFRGYNPRLGFVSVSERFCLR